MMKEDQSKIVSGNHASKVNGGNYKHYIWGLVPAGSHCGNNYQFKLYIPLLVDDHLGYVPNNLHQVIPQAWAAVMINVGLTQACPILNKKLFEYTVNILLAVIMSIKIVKRQELVNVCVCGNYKETWG